MGLGPIPEWTIQQYADRHELGDLFVRQIIMIDAEFLKNHTQQEKGSNG